MFSIRSRSLSGTGLAVAALLGAAALEVEGQPRLGPEELVRADDSVIAVPGYSVPSYTYWDGDDRKDLIIGEGSGSAPQAKVRVYLNIGTTSDPQFSAFFYVQSNGADLTVTGSGCLGAFPRVVYWDADGLKDLLVGQSDGKVRLFLNTASDEDPSFDGGTLLQVGPPGSKTTIDVGSRATPAVVDWNNDDRKDLVVGALDGRIHLFVNEGTDSSPDFRSETFSQDSGAALTVPSGRSSPVIRDLDGDGNKDMLAGNTNGQLLYYRNTGSDDSPSFSGYTPVESTGVPIDLPGTPRSRHFVCDWTGDGPLDVLVGASDGQVHLYQAVAIPGDLDFDGNVDQDDADRFTLCFTGPDGGPVGSECSAGDFDSDDDIDCDDWEQFLLAWTGPGDPPTSPPAACAEAIPVLSAWGLAAMLIVLLAAGIAVLARSRRVRIPR